jgi:hypothetical protein
MAASTKTQALLLGNGDIRFDRAFFIPEWRRSTAIPRKLLGTVCSVATEVHSHARSGLRFYLSPSCRASCSLERNRCGAFHKGNGIVESLTIIGGVAPRRGCFSSQGKRCVPLCERVCADEVTRFTNSRVRCLLVRHHVQGMLPSQTFILLQFLLGAITVRVTPVLTWGQYRKGFSYCSPRITNSNAQACAQGRAV